MEHKEIKKKAYEYFESGFHCAEVISKTTLEMFSDEPHTDVIRSASGFGGGVAGSMEETCGAFTGGVLAAGYLLGNEDRSVSFGMITEFKRKFLDKFESLKCPKLLEAFTEPADCARLTADATVILADLLNGYGLENEMTPDIFLSREGGKGELEDCPFRKSA